MSQPRKYLLLTIVVPALDQSTRSSMPEVEAMIQGIQLGALAMGYELDGDGVGIQGRERVSLDGSAPKAQWPEG